MWELYQHANIVSGKRFSAEVLVVSQGWAVVVPDVVLGNSASIWVLEVQVFETMPIFLSYTRSLGALRAPTSSWRPFGPLDC